MRDFGKRLERLEGSRSPAALAAAMTDRELAENYNSAVGELSRHTSPPCGWEAPLPQLIGWLERELAMGN